MIYLLANSSNSDELECPSRSFLLPLQALQARFFIFVARRAVPLHLHSAELVMDLLYNFLYNKSTTNWTSGVWTIVRIFFLSCGQNSFSGKHSLKRDTTRKQVILFVWWLNYIFSLFETIAACLIAGWFQRSHTFISNDAILYHARLPYRKPFQLRFFIFMARRAVPLHLQSFM